MFIQPASRKARRKKRDPHAVFEAQLRHERLHREYMAAVLAGEVERAEELYRDLTRQRRPQGTGDVSGIIREHTLRDGPTTH